jgi:hypothetical protein
MRWNSDIPINIDQNLNKDYGIITVLLPWMGELICYKILVGRPHGILRRRYEEKNDLEEIGW